MVERAHEMEAHGGAECAGCPLGMARRDFLREAALAAALMVGLSARRAGAMPVPRQVAGAARGPATVAYPLPVADGVSIDREREIILARSGEAVYAFYLSCPHQHTALRWVDKQNRFECPKHHSKYRVDGQYISGRATRSMDRYAVRVDGGEVMVDLNRVFRQDEDAEGWRSAYGVVPGGGAAR